MSTDFSAKVDFAEPTDESCNFHIENGMCKLFTFRSVARVWAGLKFKAAMDSSANSLLSFTVHFQTLRNRGLTFGMTEVT